MRGVVLLNRYYLLQYILHHNSIKKCLGLLVQQSNINHSINIECYTSFVNKCNSM
uniref:Uncharacterized protein n=1 Tax=Arundo donax TaxID=35708 RepID=A0A0A9C7E1_ARUDO